MTILKTVKLPALLLLPSTALTPAENLTSEKANQNNAEVAPYTHKQREGALLYFPQTLLPTHQYSARHMGCHRKKKPTVRGILIVSYSAFPKFVGRDLA